MSTNHQLKQFLYKIEHFYQPENPKQKDGIGHEIEHIKGVIRRTKTISDIVNNNLESYNTNTPIDINIATTVAALHDIGNVIDRDSHNHFGAGIILGQLNVEYILRVPVSCDKNIATDDKIKNALKYFRENGYDLSKLSNQSSTYKLLSTAFRIKAQFEVGYHDKDLKTENEVLTFLKEKFQTIDDETLKSLKNSLYNNSHVQIINPVKELKNITKSLHQVYPKGSEELFIIADAVQDHNIDFCISKTGIKERYNSRTLYGNIVSDADKDNVPETFAIRTLAYAVNKIGVEKKSDYLIEKDKNNNPVFIDGKPKINYQKALEHILHQANERCRPSLKDYIKMDKKHVDVMPIFEESLNYKSLNKIKGVTINEDGAHTAVTKRGEIKYDITTKCGDDIYSELDNISNTSKIRELRNDYIETMYKWGNPEFKEENLQNLQHIIYDFINSESIELAVDIYEKKCYEAAKNNFKDVVNDILGDQEIDALNKDVNLENIISKNINDTKKEIIKSQTNKNNIVVEKSR